MAEKSPAHRSRRRRGRGRVAVAGVGIVVVVGGGAAAIAATNDGGTARRVATATLASVTQTVESSGTIVSAEKAAPAFSVSGTVDSVAVQVGDRVGKGQVLARLDTTSLQAEVESDQTTLATAQQQLQADETGQTHAATSGSTGNSLHATTSAYTTTPDATVDIELAVAQTTHTETDTNALIKQIQADQKAVVTGQQKVDAAQTEVDTAQQQVSKDVAQNTKFRDAQQAACASAGDNAAQPTPTPSTTPSSTPTTTPTATPTTAPPTSNPTPPVSAECASAMADYEAFAGTLSTDTTTLAGKINAQDGYLKSLQTAMRALDTLIDQLQPTTGTPGNHGTTGNGGTTGNRGTTGNNGGGGSSGQQRTGNTKTGSSKSGSGSDSFGNGTGRGTGGGGSSRSSSNGTTSTQNTTSAPASAAQLAADQAAIDAAQAELGVAQQNLDAATLTSPIAGTVAAVGLTAGGSASGGTITIVGAGIQQVSAAVPLGEVDQVKAGQSVTVSADGVAKKLQGTVQSVGLLSSTTGSTTTFPVTITLNAGSPALFDGAGADVLITTATASRVLTVPDSAIHTTANGRHAVVVVQGAKTTTVPVTIGVAGTDLTQITSGVKAGDRVLLADPTQPLPSGTTNGTTGIARFAGGFGAFNVGGR